MPRDNNTTKRQNDANNACYTCGKTDEKHLGLCNTCHAYVCDDCAKLDETVFPCKCGVDDIVEATLWGCATFAERPIETRFSIQAGSCL